MKPQDLLLVFKLAALGRKPRPTIARLAASLRLSTSQIYKSLTDMKRAGLLSGEAGKERANPAALLEFTVHGLRYVYPPELGPVVRGLPTSYAASPLRDVIVPGSEPPPVWPWREGKVRGSSFLPLHPRAVEASLADAELYEMLALADAIRGGTKREREIAMNFLRRKLGTRS